MSKMNMNYKTAKQRRRRKEIKNQIDRDIERLAGFNSTSKGD